LAAQHACEDRKPRLISHWIPRDSCTELMKVTKYNERQAKTIKSVTLSRLPVPREISSNIFFIRFSDPPPTTEKHHLKKRQDPVLVYYRRSKSKRSQYGVARRGRTIKLHAGCCTRAFIQNASVPRRCTAAAPNCELCRLARTGVCSSTRWPCPQFDTTAGVVD
jgi:hypothetical protein